MTEDMQKNIHGVLAENDKLEQINIQILQLSLACKQVGFGMCDTLERISNDMSVVSRRLSNIAYNLNQQNKK